jgi:glucokinase
MDSIRQLRVTDHPSFLCAVQHYLREQGAAGESIGSGVFAVAGRVDNAIAHITNHPWTISAHDIKAALGVASVQLVNDFTAQAFAASRLDDEHLVWVNRPALPRPVVGDKTFVVIGPGTGLGISALLIRDGRPLVLDTEGGHAAFAATTREQFAIRELLAREHGSVSHERLLSGAGLCNILRCLAELGGHDIPGAIKPEQVSKAAHRGDPLCSRALDLFWQVFGALAGDQVLALGAWDGVFLTGGMVPRLLPELQAHRFMEHFADKGRFADAVSRVPVAAIVHPQPGLLGAAVLAAAGDDGAGGSCRAD